MLDVRVQLAKNYWLNTASVHSVTPNPRPAPRDYIPVAPSWERQPDDTDIWRRVVIMPALALNQVERELLGPIAGRRVGVLGAGDAIAPLALAALGAEVTVIDPAHARLDQLLVRCQVTGVNIQFTAVELTNLSGLRSGLFELCYAAQTSCQLSDLGRFYKDVFRLLTESGRLVINEYHPVRRIWKQEPGSPRLARSYFERRTERGEVDATGSPAGHHNLHANLGRYEYHWTVSDHVHFLIQAGFQVTRLEEIGDSHQHWEVANLRGLPEQRVIGADRFLD